MVDLICISDIHINSYTSYEYYPGFRNEQFIKAAHRVVDIGKENNCNKLAILGDLIDSPIVKPKTVHILREFIEVLATYYKEIYYILGQHDCDSKSSDWKYEDSIVNLFDDFGVMKYMNDKFIELHGTKVYFHNWCSGNMSELIPDDTDIFLTHFGISTLFGQEIDTTKFKMMIAGDIHSIIDLGNLHSVGGFLQKDLKDAPYGQVVLLDASNLKFTRIPLINNKYKFLRIYNEGEEENKDEYTWIIPKYDKTSVVEIGKGDQKFEVNLNNISTVIDKCVTEQNLQEIHKKYVDKISLGAPVDFNFDLIELTIENFRSIKNFKYNFVKNHGNIFVSGSNGSGKTSLINALFIALTGDRRISRYIKKGEDHVELTVTFMYQNIRYKIVRRNGSTEFYENDTQVHKNNKTALDNFIYEKLPFLNYLNIFYIKAKKNYFYDFFNSKLINKLFNLDELVQFRDLAINDRNTISKYIKDSEGEKLKLVGSLEAINGELSYLKSQLDETSNVDTSIDYSKLRTQVIKLDSDISSLSKSINEFEKLPVPEKLDYGELDNNIESITTKLNNLAEIDELIKEINRKDSSIKKITSDLIECPNCKEKFSLSLSKEEIERRVQELLSLKLKLDGLKYKYKDLDKSKLSSERSELINKKNSINENNRKYEKYQILKESNQTNIIKLEEAKSNLTKLLGNYDSINSLIEWCDSNLINISNRAKLTNQINSKLSMIKDITDKIDNLSKNIDSYNLELNNLNNYISFFDENSENSIYKQLIIKISQSLSDDELSFTNQNTDDENLGFQLLVDKYWINYDELSEGQKTYADLKLLNKLFKLMGGGGLLILDEFTASIDRDNIERCINMIKSIDCKVLINISHNSFLNSDFDHKLELKLVDNSSVITEEQ